MIFQKTKQLLRQLQHSLQQLNQEQYTLEIDCLDYASIGKHTRHIIEHFQALIASQQSRVINYEARKRDPQIETNLKVCLCTIDVIIEQLDYEDVALQMLQEYTASSSQQLQIKSSYYREVAYNIDHLIHHQALIKIGLKQVLPSIQLDQHFGYADATIKYIKNVHAQLSTQQ